MDEAFGFAAAQYLVVITEFGFGFNPEQPDEGNAYGVQIINYAEDRGSAELSKRPPGR